MRNPTQGVLQNSRRGPAARRAVLSGLAVWVLAIATVVPASRWSVEMDGETRPVESRWMDGVEYLSASDLAAAFGGRLRESRKSGNFVMEVAGARLVLSGREGLVSVDGDIHALPQPNRMEDGALWVGVDFIPEVVAPIYPRAIRLAGRTFVVGDLPPVDVVLRTSHDAAGTRVVLEFSHAVPYAHDTGRRGVRIQVQETALAVHDLPRRLEGGEIDAVSYQEGKAGVGGTFRFEPGPDYSRARVSQLPDPFRIIIDFNRAGGARLSEPRRDLPSDAGPRALGVHTVVLDAGHGGSEVGAQGPTGLNEKDVVLDVARHVARMLRRRLGVAVVMTRESDQVIPLDERAGIANNHDGDLFVSIHANASRGRNASGAETYFLAMQASDDAAESVAAEENRAAGVTEGTASGDDLEMILWDLAQSEHRTESFLLAETIQNELNGLLGTRDRGVRQAPFRVLMGVQMPAVLVEVAFISNPEEEAALRTAEFRERIAEAIARSIEEYKLSYESRIGLAEDRAGGRRGRDGS